MAVFNVTLLKSKNSDLHLYVTTIRADDENTAVPKAIAEAEAKGFKIPQKIWTRSEVVFWLT